MFTIKNYLHIHKNLDNFFNLYKKYIKKTIEYLTFQIEQNRINEQKRINSIDFKIGNIVLMPFRFIKKLFK